MRAEPLKLKLKTLNNRLVQSQKSEVEVDQSVSKVLKVFDIQYVASSPIPKRNYTDQASRRSRCFCVMSCSCVNSCVNAIAADLHAPGYGFNV